MKYISLFLYVVLVEYVFLMYVCKMASFSTRPIFRETRNSVFTTKKQGEINQSFSLLIVMILAGRLFQSFSNINNLRLKSTCHICITLPVLHMICNSLDKSIISVCRLTLSGLRFCRFAGKIWTCWYNFLYMFVHNCQTIKMRCHTTLSNMYFLFS